MSHIPADGPTMYAHVERMLERVRRAWARADAAITSERRLRPSEREALRRELAGVVADVESIRIWLDMGAPK